MKQTDTTCWFCKEQLGEKCVTWITRPGEKNNLLHLSCADYMHSEVRKGTSYLNIFKQINKYEATPTDELIKAEQ